jgi:NADH-quinone oxidoreductase subunit G
VPFYAGLTLDEVGGDGVRWQDREAASAAPADELPTTELEQPPSLPDGLVLGSAPTLWTGPSVEHSPSLRFLDTAPRLLVSPADARELGVENGDEVEVEANGDSTGATVTVRTGVPSGSVFLSQSALAEGPVRIGAREAVAG